MFYDLLSGLCESSMARLARRHSITYFLVQCPDVAGVALITSDIAL